MKPNAGDDPPLPAPPLRLDTYLRARAHLGRREAADAIATGEVGLARAGEVEAHRLVYPEDEVRYRGRHLEAVLPNGYWMLHKPMGVTCTRRGAETPNLGQWLRDLPEATVAIGRLDKPTTGLLLLTTDGDLTYLLTHPQHHAAKIYRLTVLGAVYADDARLAALSDGVELADGLARASRVHVTFCGVHLSHIEVRVHAGRKRMVRRMASAETARGEPASCKCARRTPGRLARTPGRRVTRTTNDPRTDPNWVGGYAGAPLTAPAGCGGCCWE